ncbi:hypothetical protein FQN50_005628 [Emmonsiellopsis sp. PD_5]|nr:hypothetical protein FQN50_005628 [Emmonsiellopsis sp. PD_5]
MLLFPLLGLIASLTLWGTFFPVPLTDIHRHESFMGRIKGAVRASLLITGTYEIALAASKVARPFQQDSFESFAGVSLLTELPSDAHLDVYCNSSWVFTPDFGTEISPPVAYFSRDMYAGSFLDFGSPVVEQSPPSSVRLSELAVFGILAFVSVCWLGLRLFNAYTPEDSTLDSGRLRAPAPKVAHHLMTSDLVLSYESSDVVVPVAASLAPLSESVMLASFTGLGNSGVNPFYFEDRTAFAVFGLRYCVPMSIPVLSMSSQLVESPVASCGLTFHPVVDSINNGLVRRRLQSSSSTSDRIATNFEVSPVDKSAFSSGSDPELIVRLPQSKALVPRRLENISQFVFLQLVFVLLAAVGDGQKAAVVAQVSRNEEPPKHPKKQRMGQRQRRRVYRSELREKQAELVQRLEAGSERSLGVNPAAQFAPPLAPPQASTVNRIVPSTAAPMVPPMRPAMPPNPQGQGFGFPPPQYPPPRQNPSGRVRQIGGQMPLAPWQYQQYGYPNYPQRRF